MAKRSMNSNKKKECVVCGIEKYFHEFRNYSGSYTKQCKECISESSRKTSKINKDKVDKFYVYKFLDVYDNVIYVGQSTNLDRRMKSHVDTSKNFTNNINYHEVVKVHYCEFNNGYHMEMYEKHLICKHYPKCNTQSKHIVSDIDLFELPEPTWYTFNFQKETIQAITRHLRIVGVVKSDAWMDEYLECIKNDLEYMFCEFNGFDDNIIAIEKLVEMGKGKKPENFYDIKIS